MPDISREQFMEEFIEYYENQKITPSTKKNAKNTFKGKAFDELIRRPCLCPTMTYMRKVSKFQIFIKIIYFIYLFLSDIWNIKD